MMDIVATRVCWHSEVCWAAICKLEYWHSQVFWHSEVCWSSHGGVLSGVSTPLLLLRYDDEHVASDGAAC